MIGRVASVALGVALALAPLPASAQMTPDQAREEGKALGNAAKGNSTLVPTEDSSAQTVPGYAGTTVPQGSYFDDPDKLINDAQALKSTNEQYQITTDASHSRPTFSNAEIKSTTQRATGVENDPSTYLAGESIGATNGQCQPLPPGAGTSGYYEATCNQGEKIEDQSSSCRIQSVPRVVNNERWFYYGVDPGKEAYGFASNAYLNGQAAAGVCKTSGVVKQICDAQVEMGAGGTDVAAYLRFCRSTVRGDATQFSCSAELPQSQLAQHYNSATGTIYLKKEGESSVTFETQNSCTALASDAMCTQTSTVDTCVEGAETRVIDGVPVTQACWAWSRDYMCKRITQGNDCSELEANAACSYVRDDCLDDPPTGGPCKVTDRVFRCPTPGAPNSDAPQYICGNDVYCINGDCEPIERKASTEFKDALVGLHAIDQAGKEFDEATMRVFSGERDGCHKPIFGLVNCCAGKTTGLVSVAAGAAALAGGPAAIAALATPFLTMFACSNDEKMLDIKDRMGFCHKVGTYCSASFLGICESKRTTYCCFESKLSRILQEQGRPQLGKPWGPPKTEDCKGFTIDEFARLDLSLMDFTEVYSDFMDAAKLPDEVQTMTDIQGEIQDYYDLHRP